MYSSDTINIAAENKRKNRQPEYCVRRPFKVCDGCVEATLGITTITQAEGYLVGMSMERLSWDVELTGSTGMDVAGMGSLGKQSGMHPLPSSESLW